MIDKILNTWSARIIMLTGLIIWAAIFVVWVVVTVNYINATQ
jgi:hypothetical protein